MKVVFNKKEYNVSDITYQEKRALWHKSVTSFSEDGSANQEEYFKMLREVEKLSGLEEKDFVDKDGNALGMADIDLLLQEIFQEYMGIKKKGKSK